MKNLKSLIYWLILLFISLYKHILNLITGKCSILRIILSTNSNTRKFILLENNIQDSKQLAKLNFLTLSNDEMEKNISTIIQIKKVKEEFHEELAQYLRRLFVLSRRYRLLLDEVGRLQHKPVNMSENPTHKEMLMRLWHNLRPGQSLGSDEHLSTRWTELGFQGKNPQTDFRGTGLLGLVQLEMLSAKHSRDCLRVMETPFEQGFPLALASINLSALVLNWLKDGRLRLALYGAWTQSGDWDDASRLDAIDSFNRLFCKIFILFNEQWQRDQPGVMHFNIQKEKFESIFSPRLEDEQFIQQLI